MVLLRKFSASNKDNKIRDGNHKHNNIMKINKNNYPSWFLLLSFNLKCSTSHFAPYFQSQLQSTNEDKKSSTGFVGMWVRSFRFKLLYNYCIILKRIKMKVQTTLKLSAVFMIPTGCSIRMQHLRVVVVFIFELWVYCTKGDLHF